ncbi:MAG: hypothetical protein A2Y71_06665 [Bacteroidetes bacterium RBG_13_42_15]|nr:MAG: hypothetical protein A2Y71_06665 [Bacteroidetes bacterium RBG_13_42_15]
MECTWSRDEPWKKINSPLLLPTGRQATSPPEREGLKSQLINSPSLLGEGDFGGEAVTNVADERK